MPLPSPTTSCGKPAKTPAAGPCCPAPGLNRRTFIRTVGAGTIATLGSSIRLSGDPMDNPNFDVNIPADKGLKPDWIQALYTRGEPEIYRKEQLNKIAMPVGGICAGQVDLSPDGRLINWRVIDTPKELAQGFALRTVVDGKAETHSLTRESFPDLTFRGEYPIAKIDYQNAAIPISTSLEVFSPFAPLDPDDSGLPATIFHFTLKNTSTEPVEATIAGGLQNGFCLYNQNAIDGTRRNRIAREPLLTLLDGTGVFAAKDTAAPSTHPDIIFEDWTKPAFEGWKVEGTAFGAGPILRADIEHEMGPLNGESPRVVNSYLPSHSDNATGTLSSTAFTVSRRYINVWLGGGNDAGKVGINLLVDGQIAISQTGNQENVLSPHFIDVRAYQGKQATLQIIDHGGGFWDQVGVGRITFSDQRPALANGVDLPDYGSTALALLGPPAELAMAKGSVGFEGEAGDNADAPAAQALIGTLGRTVQLAPGATAEATFVVAWHYPNLTLERLGKVGRYYATRFDSAAAVARYVASNFERLAGETRRWRDTWYDSTLPYWFLDRTFLNTSTLATSGCYRFADGRFYAWEGGPGCCPGTCTHVWQYAHSMARVFPQLERDTRERVDLGLARTPANGVMGFRGEFDMSLAVDGQAGTILRIYREHQMSPDLSFLKKNWEKIKNVYTPLFALDPKQEGIMDGAQMNTLDRVWFGQISWMSSMYVAAVRAGEEMANEMDDADFAATCRAIAEAGVKNIPARLFNGEYFFSIPDPKHLDTVNSGDGCYIDQVYGQSWAFQVGLPRILPETETRQALASLWKYNFSPDAGAYFAAKHTGRQFVSPGDAGMIMCTFPRTDWDYQKASGGDPAHNGFAYYFVETWTGNEYQVAAHMLWEGMLEEGLSIVRAIHERYGALRRNPWNEIECGDHYSRAMASHGVFVAACGFEHHGPRGHIGFAPRLTPENFRTPFIACEGWGTYAQTTAPGKIAATLELKSGQLKLKTLALAMDLGGKRDFQVTVKLAGAMIKATSSAEDKRILLTFTDGVTIPKDGKLQVEIA